MYFWRWSSKTFSFWCFLSLSELTSVDEQTRNKLMSCKNQCPKNLVVCGHRCSSNCHNGPCPSSELCNRKSSVRCPCRRKKKVSLLYGPMQSKWISKVMWHCTACFASHLCYCNKSGSKCKPMVITWSFFCYVLRSFLLTSSHWLHCFGWLILLNNGESKWT